MDIRGLDFLFSFPPVLPSSSSSSSGLAAAAAAAKAEAAAEKESYRGIWIPCVLDEVGLKNVEEGLLVADDRRRGSGETIPNPHEGERVHFGTHLDRGLSFPPSEFFSEVIDHYGVQLHNLPPNSLLEMSAYVALCEGFLGIRPSLLLFRFYFHVRRNSITAGVPYITGTISFSLRRDRAYPKISASDSVKQWPATFFYHRDILALGKTTALPVFVDGAATA